MATYTTLKSGSKGDDVKKLQQSLIDAGYNVGSSGADGIYGNNTAAAVKAYQKANGLTVDGIAGNQTLGKLYGGSTATTTTTPQQTPTYKYEEFKYDPYEKSDIVKQAEAMVQQHMGTEKSSWENQLNDTLNKLLNREEFSYDLNGDALYQQYKDQYMTQGKMAMMDTMGQAQAMTGGYGSSYAQSVGNQAYQGYLQQLNERVPELYQLALSQYNQEGQDLKDQASIYNNLVQQNKDEWYSMLDYYTGRADKESSDEYTKWSDKVSMDYNIHSDNQTAGYQEKSDAFDYAMSLLSSGITPASEMLAKAGISSADAQAIVNKVKEQEKAAAKVNNSGSNDGDKPKALSVDDHDKVIAQCQAYQDSGDNTKLAAYLDSLVAAGTITETYADSLYSAYFTIKQNPSPLTGTYDPNYGKKVTR